MIAYLKKINKFFDKNIIENYFKIRPSYIGILKYIILIFKSIIFKVSNHFFTELYVKYEKIIFKIGAVKLDPGLLDRMPEYEYSLKRKVKTSDLKIYFNKEIHLKKNIFKKNYLDQECSFFIHRFYWIFSLLEKYGTDKKILLTIKELILYWIGQYPDPMKIFNFESYSISERVVSWLNFYSFSKRHLIFNETEKEILTNSISKQIKFLAGNLELHGSHTNNHVLNNGRALCFCGISYDNNSLMNLGLKVLEKYYSRIIIHGSLNEGSSHYQHLIAMKFLELYKLAKHKRSKKVIEWLTPKLLEMISVCRSLQSVYQTNSMPLIGDISPDVNPGWLLGWPFSQNNKLISKWYSLFKTTLSEKRITISNFSTIYKIQVKGSFWELWVCSKNSGILPHGHCDNGSFVLYYAGSPVFIDPGLNSYKMNKLSEKLISQDVHNIPIVNGKLWDFPKNSSFNLTSDFSKAIRSGTDKFAMQLISSDNSLKVNRKFYMCSSFLSFNDTIVYNSNKNIDSIKYSLITNPGTTVKRIDNGILIDGKYNLVTNGNIKIKSVLVSRMYGKTEKTKCINILNKLSEKRMEFKVSVINGRK